MADLLLFGRLADARRAKPRRFRCFNEHLMHTVIFGLQGKVVENTSLRLLIISRRSLHNFWDFPRYASHRCTGHATMLTTRGNDRLITVHAPTTVSNNFFSEFPKNISLLQKSKPIQSATIDLTLHCSRYGLPNPCLHRYRKISS